MEGAVPMDWMLLPYKRYTDFSGRSQRKEYWMFGLMVAVVRLIDGVFGSGTYSMAGGVSHHASVRAACWARSSLSRLIPSLAVTGAAVA
jgi:uncharacterized membrane protein YhaH (DUF805 family)